MKNDSDLKILSRNLRLLIEISGHSNAEVARRAGVADGTIGGIVNARHMPGIDKVGRIAKVFGLQTYHLLMPDFRPELIKNGGFDRLYHSYVAADDEGRKLLENAAEYTVHKKNEAPNDPNDMGQTRSGG